MCLYNYKNYEMLSRVLNGEKILKAKEVATKYINSYNLNKIIKMYRLFDKNFINEQFNIINEIYKQTHEILYVYNNLYEEIKKDGLRIAEHKLYGEYYMVDYTNSSRRRKKKIYKNAGNYIKDCGLEKLYDNIYNIYSFLKCLYKSINVKYESYMYEDYIKYFKDTKCEKAFIYNQAMVYGVKINYPHISFDKCIELFNLLSKINFNNNLCFNNENDIDLFFLKYKYESIGSYSRFVSLRDDLKTIENTTYDEYKIKLLKEYPFGEECLRRFSEVIISPSYYTSVIWFSLEYNKNRYNIDRGYGIRNQSNEILFGVDVVNKKIYGGRLCFRNRDIFSILISEFKQTVESVLGKLEIDY